MVKCSVSDILPQLLPIEAAVFSGGNCLKAQHLGAKRVELNAPGSYPVGGLTPPVSEVVYAKKHLQIPLRVMIRPRGAPDNGEQDFIYSPEEIQTMKDSIQAIKDSKAMDPLYDRFVFGVLRRPVPEDLCLNDEKVVIDTDLLKELVAHARPFGTIFHRAFDPIATTNRCDGAMAALARCGVKGVLTSGGLGDAIDNLHNLRHLAGNLPEHFELIAGGGVRGDNAARFARDLSGFTGRVWLHTAAMAPGVDYSDPNLDMIDSRTFHSIMHNLTPAVQKE